MNEIQNKHYNNLDVSEFNILETVHQVWVYKWFVLIIMLITLSIGGLYASKQLPEYQSNILLQLDNKLGLGAKVGVSQLFSLGSNGGNYTATQIALIKSRFILEPVIKKLGLNLTVKPETDIFWKKFFNVQNVNTLSFKKFHVSQSLFNKKLLLIVDKPNHVSLYDDKKNLLIQGNSGDLISNSSQKIYFQVKDIHAPVGTKFQLVYQSDSRIIKNILNHMSIEESGSGRIGQSTGILDISLRGFEPILIIRTLNAIAETIQLKDSQKRSEEAAQTLAFLYKQLPMTKKELEIAENKLNKYKATSGKIDIKLQARFLLDQIANINKQYAELEIHKIQMSQQYMPAHPLYKATETQIKVLESQLEKLQYQLKRLPASDQIAVSLMRDVKVKQSLYMVLLKKIQELEVIKAGTISGVTILSLAKLPDSPLPSKKSLIYMGSVLLGFTISLILVIGRKLLLKHVDDPHWTERHLNLSNLAVVPYSNEQASGVFDKTLPLLAHTSPRNLAIESLRSLRTSLQVSLSFASNNIVSILGISPGVGKSFVSANLAFLLASGGKRVLVIDGDLRRGTLHKYFGIPSSPGLAEALTENDELDKYITQSSIHENLSLLPRGSHPSNPSELLMNNRFKNLIDYFTGKFDVIVFDTAPILLVTDGVVISGFSATNYLVLGAGVHRTQEVEMAVKRLAVSGIKVQGTIFNFHRSNLGKNNYYYGQYYGKGKYSYYDASLKI